MSSFPITAMYAAFAGLLVLLLSIRVVLVRQRSKIGIGDGSNHERTRCIRVHGNAIEYLPLLLILLGLCEAAGMSPGLLHGFGTAMMVGRLLHAYGLTLSAGVSFGRFAGTLTTFLLLLIMPLALLSRPWWG